MLSFTEWLSVSRVGSTVLHGPLLTGGIDNGIVVSTYSLRKTDDGVRSMVELSGYPSDRYLCVSKLISIRV